jgi:hypothetical protein
LQPLLKADPSRCHWFHWSHWLVAKLSRDPETRSGIVVRNQSSLAYSPEAVSQSPVLHILCKCLLPESLIT